MKNRCTRSLSCPVHTHEDCPPRVRTSQAQDFIAKCRRALKPFADMATALESMGGTTPRTGEWHTVHSTRGTATIEIEDLKRARDVLRLLSTPPAPPREKNKKVKKSPGRIEVEKQTGEESESNNW